MVGKTRREISDEKVSEPLITDNAGKGYDCEAWFLILKKH